MAVNAVTHIQVDGANRNRLLGHISMTSFAFDSGSDVWRMVKHHMSGWNETVHASPGNVLASFVVRGHLLDYWFIGRDNLVAGHAKFNAGYGCVRALVNSGVAIQALHPVSQVDLVVERDWLSWHRSVVEELLDRVEDCGTRRGKNLRTLGWELLSFALTSRKESNF